MLSKPLYLKLILIFSFIVGLSHLEIGNASQVEVKERKEISQYGITWTFEKSATTGQFITGDWWVLGPVKIVKITPGPGPVKIDSTSIKLNHYGDTSLKNDTAMRNGSMIVLKAGFGDRM